MPSAPDLSTAQAAALKAVCAEGSMDLYTLAQAVGQGPRATQEVLQTLARDGLVHMSERGRRVSCTPRGDEAVRALE